MKKSTKGALAVSSAAVLLLGGLGSLAYWSDSQDINGGTVNTGTLALGEPTCTPSAANAWVYAVGNEGAGNAVSLIVPGDTIAKTCTFEITATGDNLEAELTIPDTATVTGPPGATTLTTAVSASYTLDGGPVTGTQVITDDNDGDTVSATIEVEFPFGTELTENANDTQGILASLSNISVTLIQTES